METRGGMNKGNGGRRVIYEKDGGEPTEEVLMDGARQSIDGKQVPFILELDWNRSTQPNPRPLVIKRCQLDVLCVYTRQKTHTHARS